MAVVYVIQILTNEDPPQYLGSPEAVIARAEEIVQFYIGDGFPYVMVGNPFFVTGKGWTGVMQYNHVQQLNVVE